MNKKESLAILSSVCKQMESMSESQLFDYMMKNSNTFRTHIDTLQNMIEISLDLDNLKQDFSVSQEADIFSSDYTESTSSYSNNLGDDSWLQAA